MRRLKTPAVILLGLLLGTLAALWSSGRGPFGGGPPPEGLKELTRAAPGAEPPRVRGGPAAPVTLEEFADFQCPPCGRLHPELKKVEGEYGARLRVVFRHLPLTGIHRHALEAALAAEAAGRQGRFWEMHDLLFERQPEWADVEDARPLFDGYARALGLDADAFARDCDSDEAKGRVLADGRRADSAGVEATPTLFLQGRELSPEQRTPEGIRAAIDSALAGREPSRSDE